MSTGRLWVRPWEATSQPASASSRTWCTVHEVVVAVFEPGGDDPVVAGMPYFCRKGKAWRWTLRRPSGEGQGEHSGQGGFPCGHGRKGKPPEDRWR
jgi:hypothetical protein